MTKSTSELFEFNKMLFIYSLTVLITALWLLKMILNKKIILKKTALDIPIVIFFISQLASTIFSMDRHVSLFGYYGRFNGGLFSIISYLLLYYAFVSNDINIKKTFKAILSSSLLVILWAIPGHFGHDLTCWLFTSKFDNSCWDNATLAFRPELRAFSTLGQPNWLGAYLAAVFFIGVYFLIKNFKNVETRHALSLQILSPIYLFLNFSMILFTRSRSAILSVIVGLILFAGYHYLFIKTNFKKILIVLLIVTVLPVIFFKTGEEKIDKYLSISNIKDQISKTQIKNQKVNDAKINPGSKIENPTSTNVTESFDIRKIVWEGAWNLAKKFPLFGTGVETFAYSYGFVRPIAHNLTSEWDYVYNKAHNEYFNYLATTGFIGLISYLLLIITFILFCLVVIPLKKGIQTTWIPAFAGMTKPNNITIEQSNNETILIVCLLISYITILITNFFGFSTTTTQLLFYLIPAFVIIGESQNKEEIKYGKVNIYQWLTIFVIAASAIYLIFSIIIYYLADVNYSYGLKYSKVNDQQKAASYFEKALKMRQEPVYMDRFSSSLAYLSAVASLQKQPELSKQIANLSDEYNRKTILDYPKNVFYWKTRAKNMYYFFQITDNENELLQGIQALKTAQTLSPADPKIPYTLSLYTSMLFDLSKNNNDKQKLEKSSLDYINTVIKLKSNYREGYLMKGQLLKKYGLTSEAKKVFEYMLENFDKNDAEALKELNDK